MAKNNSDRENATPTKLQPTQTQAQTQTQSNIANNIPRCSLATSAQIEGINNQQFFTEKDDTFLNRWKQKLKHQIQTAGAHIDEKEFEFQNKTVFFFCVCFCFCRCTYHSIVFATLFC